MKRALPSRTHPWGPRRQPLSQIAVPGTHPWDSLINSLFLPQGSLTSRDYALSKCYLPFEDRVLTTYGAVVSFLVLLVLAHFERLPSSLLSGWKRCRTHMRRWWSRWWLPLGNINRHQRHRTCGGAHVSRGGEQIVVTVLVRIMGIPNHPRQWLQSKRLPVLLSCYENRTCTRQHVCLFVLSNICRIKGCICTVYKCHGHCHLHAQHTALASPERTRQSWCTLEASCAPKSWIFLCPSLHWLSISHRSWSRMLKRTDSICRNLFLCWWNQIFS